MQHAACVQTPCDMRHAAFNRTHATCNMHHAPCTMQHATRDKQHATCNMRHATCIVHHARTWNPARHGIPHGTVSRTAQYPTRHGIPHCTVSHTAPYPARDSILHGTVLGGPDLLQNIQPNADEQRTAQRAILHTPPRPGPARYYLVVLRSATECYGVLRSATEHDPF